MVGDILDRGYYGRLPWSSLVVVVTVYPSPYNASGMVVVVVGTYRGGGGGGTHPPPQLRRARPWQLGSGGDQVGWVCVCCFLAGSPECKREHQFQPKVNDNATLFLAESPECKREHQFKPKSDDNATSFPSRVTRMHARAFQFPLSLV